MKILTLTLALLLSTSVFARISEDLKSELPKYHQDAKFRQFKDTNALDVKGVVITNELYSQSVVFEIEIEEISYDKEIYLVNRSSYESNKLNTRVKFVSDEEWLSFDPTNQAQILYVGRGNGNTSRFLVYTRGLIAKTTIDLYVKMDHKQYTTKLIIE